MAHFLDLATAGRDACRTILDEAHRRKAARRGWPKGKTDTDAPLAGHVLATIFERPSTRTRISFDMAMRQLGGTTIVLSSADMQLGRGETIADTARVMSRYVDAIMIRTGAHAIADELARCADVPVINGLTELFHPCQALADVMTVEERLGRPVAGTVWSYLGDGNNMTHSLIQAGSVLGFDMRLATPKGYDADASVIATATAAGATVSQHRDARDAVAGVDVVVTDTWVSMGQTDSAEKIAAMMPFQVNEALMQVAGPSSVFLHCLPAHRGEEATDGVLDGPQSAIWDEAENRLHIQKAILLWCLGKLG